MPTPRKPTAGFWIVVAVCVLIGYPLSFGPACLLVDRGYVAAKPVANVFWPLLVVIPDSPGFGASLVYGYVDLWHAQDDGWTMVRVLDAAGLIPAKFGHWPADPRHDVPHRSSEHYPDYVPLLDRLND